MSKKVTEIEDALAVLVKMNVGWATANRIPNSLWDTGVAFFGKNHCGVTYYDETHNVLSFN